MQCGGCIDLPGNPIKTSLLEARVVTAGKGGEGGKVLDNLKTKLINLQRWGRGAAVLT